MPMHANSSSKGVFLAECEVEHLWILLTDRSGVHRRRDDRNLGLRRPISCSIWVDFGASQSQAPDMLSKLKRQCGQLQSPAIWRHSQGTVEPDPKITIRKEPHARWCDQVRQRSDPWRLQLHEAPHQHGEQSGPDRGLDIVGCSARESPNFLALLQRVEQALYPPPTVVEGRHRGGSRFEVPGQELKCLMLLLAVERRQTHLHGDAVPDAHVVEADDLILLDPSCLVRQDRQVLGLPVYSAVLQPRNEVNPLICPVPEQFAVIATAIIHGEHFRPEPKGSGHRHLANLAFEDYAPALGRYPP